MVKHVIKFNPQLVIAEHLGLSVVDLTDKQKLSLYKKSQQSGYPTSILEEVYNRGIISWEIIQIKLQNNMLSIESIHSFQVG